MDKRIEDGIVTALLWVIIFLYNKWKKATEGRPCDEVKRRLSELEKAKEEAIEERSRLWKCIRGLEEKFR